MPCLRTYHNFVNKFWKGLFKEHFYEIISKSDQWFQRRRFLRIFPCPYSARSPHSPEPCLWTDQNFANNVWKGSPEEHSCEIISKSDPQFQRRRFFKQFLHVCIVKEAPIHQSHVYGRIKISRTVFENGHPRNISVKLFQNHTSLSRGDDF